VGGGELLAFSGGIEFNVELGHRGSSRRPLPEEATARLMCWTRGIGPQIGPAALPVSTTLVPTAMSDTSRSSTDGDDGDAGDAHGHIDTRCMSAGGRKVAGPNPAAPTTRKPAREAGFGIWSSIERE
jgi:hypothetical protein